MKLNRDKDDSLDSAFPKPKEYTPEEIERRSSDIPSIDFLPGTASKNNISFGFSDCDFDINLDKASKKPLPASIEYSPYLKKVGAKNDVFYDQDAEKIFLETGSKISQKLKANFATELNDKGEFQFDDGHSHKLSNLTKQPETPESELVHLNLASTEKVQELTHLHMDLYSILSRVQEVKVASDLKDAYDIQDRISYVLDNQSLLMEKLVDSLIDYLKEIVQKLSECEKEIRLKQARFNEFNRRVSKLKEYKYKTDLSFNLLDENKSIAEEEIDRNLKALDLVEKKTN